MDLRRILTLDYWLNFIKFDVVGIIGVFVNEGLFLLLLFEGAYYLYADALAIEVSILSNYLLNEFWTFRDRRHGHMVARLLKFNGLMLVGLAVNLAILYGLTEYFGVVSGVSNLAGIGAAFLLRYWMSVRFVWMKKEEESVVPALSAGAPA
ncbi:MAG: GtrA family protein [Nitrososphaerota archaeon]|nr:GtrA family protein [Nitrososphaerota archaeon]